MLFGAPPGLSVSQHGHLSWLLSFITAQVGHFHLLLLSGSLNPYTPQEPAGLSAGFSAPFSTGFSATGAAVEAEAAGGAEAGGPKANRLGTAGTFGALPVVVVLDDDDGGAPNEKAGGTAGPVVDGVAVGGAPNDEPKSAGTAMGFCTAGFAPGLSVSQQGHWLLSFSFITAHVGHFHLLLLSGALNPAAAQVIAGASFFSCGFWASLVFTSSFAASFPLSLSASNFSDPIKGAVVAVDGASAALARYDEVKSAGGAAGESDAGALVPGLDSSQAAHLSSLLSFMLLHVGHFHLFELSGNLIPADAQSEATLATPAAPAAAAIVPIIAGAAETTSETTGDAKPIFCSIFCSILCFMDDIASATGLDS